MDGDDLTLVDLPFFNIIDDTELAEVAPYSNRLQNFENKIFNPFDDRMLVEENAGINYDENIQSIQSKCKYRTVDELISLMESQHSKNLSIIHFNTRSLPSKECEIKIFLQQLNKNPIQVIIISETWLNKENETFYNKLFPNYNAFYSSRDHRGGGVAIYVLKGINCKERTDLKFSLESCDCKTVELINDGSKNTLITGLYKPPNININEFNTHLNSFLSIITNERKNSVLAGDTNIDLLKCPNHPPTEQFLNLLYSHNHRPLIYRPTRVTSHSATLIDNIFSNMNNFAHCDVILMEISDHFPVFALTVQSVFKNKKRKLTYRQYNQINITKFKNELASINWNPLFDITNIDDAFLYFKSVLIEVYNRCFPVIEKLVKCLNDNNRPWITNAIIKSSRTKNKLYNKYLKFPSNFNFLTYKNYKRIFSSTIKNAEKLYYRNKFLETSGNIKGTWAVINNILHRHKNNDINQDEFLHNNQTLKDPSLIANTFNDFFSTIGMKINTDIGNSNNSHIDYLNALNKNFSLFQLNEISREDLISLIKNLKNSSSSSFDNINPVVVKNCPEEFATPLLYLYNKSLKDGIFPTELKVAKVVPLHKSGDKNLFTNYRPISILSIFSKLLEKIVHKQLYSHIKENDILYDLQFGFREKHSTFMAVLQFVENIRKALENDEYSIGLFLDLSKAFDTLDHDILLNKLEYYGIKNNSLNFFKSYLENRTQSVLYNNIKSDSKVLPCGVPQGSVLGPLLFILYINDMYLASSQLNTVLFADDTNLLKSHKNIDELTKIMNEELSKIDDWFKANKLSLNYSKTKFIVFTKRRKPIGKQIKIMINNQEIERVKFTNFLGVIIDEHIDWREHIRMIEKKIAKTIGILFKIKHLLNAKSMLAVYNSLIFSYLSYCNIIWGCNTKTSLKRILLFQKTFLRLLTSKNRRTHTAPLFKQFKILKIDDLYVYLVSQFVFKWLVNDPTYTTLFKNYFTKNEQIHHYNTRQINNLYPGIYRSKEIGFFSITVQGPRIWNSFPNYIKDIRSFDSFKTCIKSYLISNIEVN